jgi:16S rRNA G966 N2-methylase RsmD
MKLETLRIADLTLDPNNARQHDEKNLKAIQGSLKEFGQRKPIVITEAGTIVAGNGTVEAAKRLGWLDIEVVRVPADWTDAQVKAFAIADNRTAELANWNQEVLTSQLLELEAEGWELAEFGFEAFELPQEDKPIIEDEVPESAPSRVALGDIWQLGNHRLMCSDATNQSSVELLMNGTKADMVFTDPPYGIDVVNKTGNIGGSTKNAKAGNYSQVIGDDKPYDPSHLFSFDCFIFIWGANYFIDKLPSRGQWVVWDKNRPEGTTFSDCELAWTNGKGIAIKKYKCTWDGFHREGESEKRIHPTQKPIKLCSDILKNLSKDNAVVVDLFGGSGSTLISAEHTNRNCYMMELDPKYCDLIIERWQRLTGQKAELLPAKAD